MGINNPSGGSALWTLLHDETLAAAGRFDVSGISQSFEHLKLYLLLRSDVAATNDSVNMFFNGDTTAANYRRSAFFGGSATGNTGADNAAFLTATAATSPADYFTITEGIIPFYTGDKTKAAEAYVFRREEATPGIYSLHQGLHWENTTAITQLTIQPDGYAADELIAGSVLQIFGIAV